MTRQPAGLWLPLITPFRDDRLDEVSLRRLVKHYAALELDGRPAVDGLIVAATTGEGLTLDDPETQRLVDLTRSVWDGRPLYVGLSGSHTAKLVKTLRTTADWPVDGYLVACPYYTRPSQDGLYRHFTALADASDRPVLIYNIPYRTGVNLGNDTMLRLAEHPHIVGVKDCCADAGQSFDLLAAKPGDFSVLTGEDALFHTALTQGAEGGILASAHVDPLAFATIRNRVLAGDSAGALDAWRALVAVPRLLFSEPSPGPIKYWLWQAGLIDSPDVRLPMTGISPGLADRISRMRLVRR